MNRLSLYTIEVVGIALLSSWLCAQAPEILWTKTYGGPGWDTGYSMQETDDGGFIIAGCYHQVSNDDREFYIVKTDPQGEVIWERIFGDSLPNGALSIDQTSDGGFILGGLSGWYGGTAEAVIMRLDDTGDSLWSKTYSFELFNEFRVVQQTIDGGYIAAGNARDQSAGLWKTVIVKFNEHGDTVWTSRYGGSIDDYYCYAAQQTYDGGYALAGWTTASDPGWCDFFLLKTDKGGDSAWVKTYGYAGQWDDAYSVRQTTDSGYVLVGVAHPTGLEAGDVYVVKTDMQGDAVWTLLIAQAHYDFPYAIAQTGDAGYIIANIYEYSDFQAIRLNEHGDTMWTSLWGGFEFDWPYAVCECLDGGFALAGFTESFGYGLRDACLIKLVIDGVAPSLDIWPEFFYDDLVENGTVTEELAIINEGDGFLFWEMTTTQQAAWITIDSAIHWVNPHDTLVVPFTLSSWDLSQGTYSDTLLISSNDSLNPELRIHVGLKVYPRNEIFVFPNPAFLNYARGGMLTFINLPANGTIWIYDIAGRMVWEHAFENPGISYCQSIAPVLGSAIASGVYFYHIDGPSGSIIKKGKFSVVE